MNLEAMKAQTIGVEVEMNNITRENAAKVASKFFGTDQFKGDGHWADTAWRNGYSCWSAWDKEGREWMFKSDCSIHGPSAEQTELVTPVLHYSDIELLQGLIRELRHAGAKSDPTRGCGVHIHIGVKCEAGDHNPKTLRNLANIMAAHETLLALALDITDPDRIGHYCKPVDPRFIEDLNRKKPATMEDLSDVWYESQCCSCGRSHHYNDSRYHMLNYHPVFVTNDPNKKTVEFRLFQFDAPADGKQNGLHAGQLKSYIQLCLALSQAAKEARSASPRQTQQENPKYAMRTWLLRLGFIGDEFKTARDVLTRKLPGDTAFRHGRPAAA